MLRVIEKQDDEENQMLLLLGEIQLLLIDLLLLD
jgi:hypothetical protein